MQPTLECQNSVSQLMVQVRAFLNGLDLIPRRTAADPILLALLSKSIVLTESIVILVRHGNHDEAFGLCRTCIEIELTVRYLTNADTVKRCERYLLYFAKDTTEWANLFRKYYPNHKLKRRSDAMEIEKLAGAYRCPHRWHDEKDGIKTFASEDDSFERAADGSPLRDSFSYEIPYKWMSHYVHATVQAIEPAHVTLPGDRFKVHPGDGRSSLGCEALLFSFQAVYMNLIRVLRYFNMSHPPSQGRTRTAAFRGGSYWARARLTTFVFSSLPSGFRNIR